MLLSTHISPDPQINESQCYSQQDTAHFFKLCASDLFAVDFCVLFISSSCPGISSSEFSRLELGIYYATFVLAMTSFLRVSLISRLYVQVHIAKIGSSSRITTEF